MLNYLWEIIALWGRGVCKQEPTAWRAVALAPQGMCNSGRRLLGICPMSQGHPSGIFARHRSSPENDVTLHRVPVRCRAWPIS